MRARADAGDRFAARRLADLLAQQGRTDELRAQQAAGERVPVVPESVVSGTGDGDDPQPNEHRPEN